MTASHLAPELHSVGPAVAAIYALAFVLARPARVQGASQLATKASKDVLVKAERLAKALQAVQAEQQTGRALAESLDSVASHAELAFRAEVIAESLERYAAALGRARKSLDQFDRALDETTRYGSFLERRYPGWPAHLAKVRPLSAALRSDIEHAAVLRDDQGTKEVREVLSASLAETGLSGWARALPQEAEPLYDNSDAVPLHWDESVGWVEGSR